MSEARGLVSAAVHLVAGVGAGAESLLVRASLVTGFLLIGAVIVSRLFERKVAASLRLLLFAVVFLRLVLPGDWTSPVGLLGRAAGPAAASVGGVAGGVPEVDALASAAGGGRGFWLGLGYLLVASWLLSRWIAARAALARQLRRALPVDPTRLAAATAMGLPAAPVTEHPTLGPLVAGVLRPRIVLPATFLRQADPETLGFVLAHEAAHVARRDHWLLALVQLATIAAWPVLPLWLAARQIRTLCELACDERVLLGRPAEQRRRYGLVLLRLSEGDFALAPAQMVPSFAWDLRRRVRALGRRRGWNRGGQLSLVGACGALLLACSAAPEAPAPSLPAASADAQAVVAPASERACPPDALCGLRGPLLAPPPFPGGPVRRPESTPGTSSDTATLRGSLDKEVIREVIRGHILAIKACYESALAKDPTLAGKLTASFTIAATGAVVASKIEHSTLADPAVARCTAKEIRSWVFPPPEGGGIVVVQYPFSFSPD